MASKRLTIPQRKEIFQDLVATQDSIHNVRKSYEVVTEKFEITVMLNWAAELKRQ